MTDSLGTLVERGASGVFRCAADPSLDNVRPDPYRTHALRLHAVRDKNAFLKACAAALHFPEYFGHNWDAFYDCLLDVDPGAGLLIVLREASAFARADPEEFAAAIDTLADAADYWRENGKALLVVVELEAPALAPELPEINCRAK